MFVYLSKKVAIPNNVKLRTISWNNDQGWIACGGDDGLLKVLKLDPAPTTNTTSANSSSSSQQQDGQVGKSKGGGADGGGAAPSAPSNLSMNQSLEGHTGAVLLSTWNTQHRKLTTSDSQGLIIVWILYKGMWYEEMINNRNKSVVTDMQWNRDGEKICIVYEDGAVIVGSVDGNRIWGKEFKNMQLAHLQWAPDSKGILFATATGELQVYDANGNFNGKLSTIPESAANVKIAAMDWYNGANGYMEPRIPCLAICFENGRIYILRDDKDLDSVVIDTNMRHVRMKWNHNGSVLAVSGTQSIVKSTTGTTPSNSGMPSGKIEEAKEYCVVQFYGPYGNYLRSLKVPGKRISSLSWDHTSLRIALAIDSYIYFANVRPDYRWTFFAEDVLVYAYNRKPGGSYVGLGVGVGAGAGVQAGAAGGSETVVVFWNTKTGERGIRYVLGLYNGIGVCVESRLIDFEPRCAVLTRSHVFVASSDGSVIMDWQWNSGSGVGGWNGKNAYLSAAVDVGSLDSLNESGGSYKNVAGGPKGGMVGGKLTALEVLRKKEIKERAFHIDDIKSMVSRTLGGGGTGKDSDRDSSIADVTAYLELRKRRPSNDPVTSMAASDSHLYIARQSGSILKFALSTSMMSLEGTMSLQSHRDSAAATSSSTTAPSQLPQPVRSMYLNCNSTRLAVLDMAGVLRIFDVDGSSSNVTLSGSPNRRGTGVAGGGANTGGVGGSGETSGGKMLDLERKDVWDVKWAQDNPELFAMMEKTRMYIFRNLDPEEPIACAGYICCFNQLQIKAVMLDEIMRDPDAAPPVKEQHVVELETKSLRDTRNILNQVGLADAVTFVDNNPHPRLWKLIAEGALEVLELGVAQKAFVRCLDYGGCQFVKKLMKLDDRQKQRAEVRAYCGQFDLAEKCYLELDRKDLAIDLRIRLGDWFRVVQLIRSNPTATGAVGAGVVVPPPPLATGPAGTIFSVGGPEAAMLLSAAAAAAATGNAGLGGLVQGIVNMLGVAGGTGMAADDILLEKAWNAIGDHYHERRKWVQAITYYAQARNMEKLAECYYVVEDYDGLEKLVHALADNHPLLKNISNKFVTVGMCDQAVAAVLKAGDIKAAVDICVHLNQWNTAVELAEIHKSKEIETLLAKYASYLLEKDKLLNAIELYRKANHCQKSAKLLFELARKAAKSNKNPMRVKKLYVLAALEVERFHHLNKGSKMPQLDQTAAALDSFLVEDARISSISGPPAVGRKSIGGGSIGAAYSAAGNAGGLVGSGDKSFLEEPWRGAKAYHFYLLAQRQYYAGNMDGAVKTALHLREYEDVIEPKTIYSLLALVSLHNKQLGTCSKAFIKLESLPDGSDEEREMFENLALSIFTKYGQNQIRYRTKFLSSYPSRFHRFL
ncbi:WD repeat-containing protein 35 [Quaeritorhiza haematococci]|nr:WD repeat-containing protein 35 [Quaeritorhiza haematococci]